MAMFNGKVFFHNQLGSHFSCEITGFSGQPRLISGYINGVIVPQEVLSKEVFSLVPHL
jgi:hypothetical protein